MAFFADNNETQKVDNSLWVEQYRPTTLENYVGNDHLKDKVKGYIESGDVPHLLLYGRAGTGKTTLAKLITKSVDCDYMIINASDENNVDMVRNKVKGFASTVGFKPLKIVILDEFDYMSQNAQAILRNLMETFSKHCRFILTCNYVEKVIEPIQSRCQTFQIVPPTKKDVAIQISKILKSNDDKRNRYMKLRQTLIDSRVTDFTELFTLLYDKVDEYAPSNTANVIIALSQGQTNHFHSIDKEIPMAACLIEINSLL